MEDRRKAFYLTAVCHYDMSYNRQGEQTGRAYSEDILSREEEDAFLKGGGKGKGKAFPKRPQSSRAKARRLRRRVDAMS